MNVYSRIITGLGIGSFVYLINIFFQQSVMVTSKSIIFVFLVSIFVSVTTVIFDSDRFGLNVALLIHYLCVACFILVFNYVFWGSENLLILCIHLTSLYAISYCLARIKQALTVKELNKYLKELEIKRER